MEFLIRCLVGGAAVTVLAALGDILRPKSFAGLFGAAPSIALATLALAASQKGSVYVSVQARSMIAGAGAMALYASACCYAMFKLKLPASLVSVLGHATLGRFGLGRPPPVSGECDLRVSMHLGALARTRWYDYALRCGLGGLATVATGLIAPRYGASVGGVFLASRPCFPPAPPWSNIIRLAGSNALVLHTR